MRLNEVLEILRSRGLGKVGTWEFRGRKGIYLGDPKKYFPHPTGPQYPVDTTDEDDPDLAQEEVDAIMRRFDGD
jgi:hypothetical protein